MRVRYTLRAQADLNGIFSYAGNPAAAQSVKNTIERRISLPEEFPRIAPETDTRGVYELTIIRYPYKVYYEISDDGAWILHIRDARRRPWIK
jgi:toxin ParE1/3/4